jgi:hypothetical protein
MAIDLNEESHQMILMHTYNSTASSEDGLFDICLKLLNWFLKKWLVLSRVPRSQQKTGYFLFIAF